jgi:hypothetical protein
MDSNGRPAVRIVRRREPRDNGATVHSVLRVPERGPRRTVAPDWVSPTEDNGLAIPRDTLHVIVLAHNEAARALLANNLRVVTPPLWKGGEVQLHIVTSHNLNTDDIRIRQTLVDLGLVDSYDVDIAVPTTTDGYPSGDTE